MQHLHQFLHLSDKGTSAVECMIPQILAYPKQEVHLLLYILGQIVT